MLTKAEVLKGMSLIEFNARCQYDFKFFCERLLGLTDCGGIQEYMVEWFKLVMGNDYVMIQAPSGFAKTTIFEAIALWIVWNNFHKKVMIIANTEGRAKTIIGDINTFIMGNELIHELKPKDFKETWNKKELMTTTKCRIFCKPYTPNMRGERSDFTLVDEADAEAYNDVKIFKDHVISRLNPGSKIALISTPDSTTGLMSYIKDTDKDDMWVFKKYVAIVNMKTPGDYSSGESLWKDRFSLKYLLEKKKVMKDAFEKIYMCDEKAEGEDSIFKVKYLIDCFDERFKFEQKSGGGLIIIGCDFGYSRSPRADDTVYIVLEKFSGFFIIRYIEVQPKGVTLHEKTSRISELFEQYKHTDKNKNCIEPIIICDSSSVGSDVINELRTKGFMVVEEPFSAPSRKDMYRVLQNVIENKKLVIPRDPSDENVVALTNLMVEQLLGFIERKSIGGSYQGTVLASTAPHDDIASALVMAVKEGTRQITGDFFVDDKKTKKDMFKEANQLDIDNRVEWDWNEINK